MKTIILNKTNRVLSLEKFRWLSAAVSTDKTRETLNYIYATDEKKLVATDGRRLHLMELPENEFDGYGFETEAHYKVLSKKASEVLLVKEEKELTTFPNYKQVIPAPDEKDGWKYGDFKLKKRNPNGVLSFYSYIQEKAFCIFQDELFTDATGIKVLPSGKEIFWRFFVKDEMTPLFLQSIIREKEERLKGEKTYLSAVVMPVRPERG